MRFHLRHTWQPEQRIGLCSHPDGEQRGLRLLIDLCFPVINLVLFGNGQVRHYGTFGVEELYFRAALDETICYLQFGLELPS